MPKGVYFRTVIARANISKSRKGKPSPSKGKSWPIESRIRFSMAQRGTNGNNWQGGIEHIHRTIRGRIEFSLWRMAIYTRDNWTCQKCLVRGGKLHPHHIKNFSEFEKVRFAIDNGITLCIKCHNTFHKLYGFIGNNLKQINDYLMSSNWEDDKIRFDRENPQFGENFRIFDENGIDSLRLE